LSETAVPADPVEAEAILVRAFVARGIPEDAAGAAARLRFAGIEPDIGRLAAAACAGAATLPPLDLLGRLTPSERRAVETGAPGALPLPSGRTTRLHYRDDGSVIASVKLQELFG